MPDRCSVCGRKARIRADGTVAEHRAGTSGSPCAGGYKKPVADFGPPLPIRQAPRVSGGVEQGVLDILKTIDPATGREVRKQWGR